MISTRIVGAAWETFIDFLLPRLCCDCGQRVHQSQWLICETCLDAIPPLTEPICSTCGYPDAHLTGEGKCRDCPKGTVWFQSIRTATTFESTPKLLVEKLKYHNRIEYAHLLALAMARAHQTAKSPAPQIIIPVPLHKVRQRERGFNQSALLANHLTGLLGAPCQPRAITRIRPTPTQTRLKKRDRQRNVKGAFQCPKPHLIQDQHVLLVDDVCTTGSTLNECARILIQAGAHSVQCLTYARAKLG